MTLRWGGPRSTRSKREPGSPTGERSTHLAAAIEASLTKDERREILKGMCLTRSVDNRLKQFFMGGEVRWRDTPFQGKGFRSLGQEAIYAAGIRLRLPTPRIRRGPPPPTGGRPGFGG